MPRKVFRITCEETEETIEVEDFANFLRDLVFLHDRLVLLYSDKYERRDYMSRSNAFYFYRRRSRHLVKEDKIFLSRIVKESPLIVDIDINQAVDVVKATLLFIEILKLLAKHYDRSKYLKKSKTTIDEDEERTIVQMITKRKTITNGKIIEEEEVIIKDTRRIKSHKTKIIEVKEII